MIKHEMSLTQVPHFPKKKLNLSSEYNAFVVLLSFIIIIIIIVHTQVFEKKERE